MPALDAWAKAAEQLGLAHRTVPGNAVGRFEGTLGACRLTLAAGGDETRIVAEAKHLLVELRAGPRNLSTRAMKLLQGRQLFTGDPTFDAGVYVRTATPLAIAVLDRDARGEIRGLVRGPGPKWEGGTLESKGHRLTWSFPTLVDNLFRLCGVLRTVAGLATRLDASPPCGMAARLAANAVEDPVVGVRRFNLQLLVREFPEHTATVKACRSALAADVNPEIRIDAARHLGPKGWSALAEVFLRQDLDVAARKLLLGAVVDEHPRSALRPVLERALQDRSAEVQRIAIDAVDRLQARGLAPRLFPLLRSESVETLAAAAATLGSLGERRAESDLIRLLRHSDSLVQAAALGALKRVGGVRAVEPLLDLARRSPGLRARGLRAAAKDAVAAIQRRLKDAAPGRLTLAEPGADQGGLTLAEDRGALSLPPEPDDLGRADAEPRP
ncbi:MAG: HEAT repeat domain-containing protein [Planctomycetes bacterium]|nr:HEAT repeat domain-containing protein [Planctomycetota bacterium]